MVKTELLISFSPDAWVIRSYELPPECKEGERMWEE